MKPEDPHQHYMHIALNLARQGLGRTWPNPSVGCVIVKNGEIISRGRTGDGGRPHAESLALEAAGENARGATAYVTLEPCSHHGKTPPCAESLIAAGISEVIASCIDPDKRVSGQGLKMLEDAGIKVTTGVLEKECRDLNKGFFSRIERGVPYVTLKAATSRDGKYLEGTGRPKWVTGEIARNNAHLMRSQYDAILTGTGTVLADNPYLNCRLPGMEDYSPLKIVVGHTPIPETANILKGRECWLLPALSLSALAEKGITRLMVEAGPTLSNALLKTSMVDEVVIFQSPDLLESEGENFFTRGALDNYRKTEEREVGDDLRVTLKRVG